MRHSRLMPCTTLVFGLGIGLAAPPPGAAQDQLPTVTIGLVTDGEFNLPDVPGVFLYEMRELLASDFRVRVPPEKQISADWSAAGAASALDRLLADGDVDLVLTLGPVSAREAVSRTDLPKPVVALPIFYTEWQDLPHLGEGSGVPNLHYLALAPRDELVTFREVLHFDTVAVLIDETLVQTLPQVSDSVRSSMLRVDIVVEVVPVGRSVDPVLPVLDRVDAVYLLSVLQLPSSELDRLIAEMIDRGLPSFTAGGRADVEAGVFAGLRPTNFLRRVARRAALNVQRILLGGDASRIPVVLESREALVVNLATARAIGRYPTWITLIEAELVDPARSVADNEWSLETAVREAVSVNRDLAALRHAVDAGGEDVSRATSFLLPQIGVSADGVIIDEDRAETSFGNVAERTLSASGTLTQQIFDEPTWANRSIQSSVQRSRELDRNVLELDVALDAGVTYLNVLRAKTFERIQQENLALTRANLELAQVRRAVGTATPGEVYRWETQIANARQAVIDANAARNRAEIQLNRLLNRPLEEPFLTEEADLGGFDFMAGKERLLPFIDDPWSFHVFRGFMSEEALRNAPELQAIDALTSAQDRAASSAGRRLWVPSVGLQAGVTEILNQGGAGSGDPVFPEIFPVPDDTDWFVGLSATYPLFEGGARLADRRQARKELASLEAERESVAQRVEERVRSALHDLGASRVGIDLSRAAADAAHRNYQLVREAYSRGAISILDLLDAQNVALVADEDAANAMFDFLIDLMRAQRAAGRSHVLVSAEEKDAFFERAEAYFAAAGVPPREQ